MTMTAQHGSIERIARCGLALGAALVLLMGSASDVRAQSNGASAANSKADTAGADVRATQNRTAAPENAARSGGRQAASAQEPPSGKREAIGVSGYWKIDVRNTDGTLASHTEFENTLTTNDAAGRSGDAVFASFLTGGFAGKSTNASGQAVYHFVQPDIQVGVNTNGFASSAPTSGQTSTVAVLPTGPCGGQGCLEPSATQIAPGTNNQVLVTSSFLSTSTATFSISQVETFLNTFTTTINFGSGTVEETFAATPPYSLTSATLSTATPCMPATQACAVAVANGQTVSISVLLSFH